MKGIISELRDEGKAIIFSTHQMNQVEELCDRVLMIHQGSEVLYGELKEVKKKFRKHSVLVNIEGEFGEMPGVKEMKPGKDCVELVLTAEASPRDILDQLQSKNLDINRFELKTPSLHEIFLKIAGVNNE